MFADQGDVPKHGYSDPSYYAWKARFGGRKVSDAQRLKALESENVKLKRLLSDVRSVVERTTTTDVRTAICHGPSSRCADDAAQPPQDG